MKTVTHFVQVAKQSCLNVQFVKTLVGKILDGITIDCKFKDYGCDKIINLVEQHKHQSTCQYRSTCKYEEKGCFHILQPGETSLDHENECVYRTVSCFHKECQPNGVIMPIKNLKDHYYKYHKRSGHVFNNVDEKEAFFEITATPGPISFFYQNGKPIFMFEGWLGVKDLKESVQGCLVTMKSPEEAKKLQCSTGSFILDWIITFANSEYIGTDNHYL